MYVCMYVCLWMDYIIPFLVAHKIPEREHLKMYFFVIFVVVVLAIAKTFIILPSIVKDDGNNSEKKKAQKRRQIGRKLDQTPTDSYPGGEECQPPSPPVCPAFSGFFSGI